MNPVGPGWDSVDPVDPRRLGLGWEKPGKPDACRQDPVLYSVPCLVILLLVFVATVVNMEAESRRKK